MMTEKNERFSRGWQLFGYALLDARGTRVGPVNRVWADNATGSLKFIGVRTGRIARVTRVIPAAESSIDSTARSVSVPYAAARIRGAPPYNTDIPLTDADERKVATYYGNA
jgi:hypothetical protein